MFKDHEQKQRENKKFGNISNTLFRILKLMLDHLIEFYYKNCKEFMLKVKIQIHKTFKLVEKVIHTFLFNVVY